MRLSEVSQWQASPRVTIRKGSIVRLAGGGPEYVGADGSIHRYRMPGRFLVRAIYQAKSRTWLEVSGLDSVSGCYVVFVGGKPYKRSCLRHRPYKVKIKRTQSQKRLAFG